MKLIETKTLTAAAASIEFTSIPQTFTDLVLLFSAGRNGSISYVQLAVNGSTTNGSSNTLLGQGNSVTGSSSTTLIQAGAGASTIINVFSNAFMYVSNYASTTTTKTISFDAVTEQNGTVAFQGLASGLWNNTSAITSLRIELEGGSPLALRADSTFSLYGITKGSDGITTAS
jgi:hypothetical protein